MNFDVFFSLPQRHSRGVALGVFNYLRNLNNLGTLFRRQESRHGSEHGSFEADPLSNLEFAEFAYGQLFYLGWHIIETAVFGR